MDRRSIFLQAIKGTDGQVNVGYLFLFKVLRMFWFELAVMTVGAVAAMYASWPKPDDMVKVLSAYGVAVGIVASANFLTALTGIAAFLWGDSRAAPQATTTTTTTTAAPIVPVIAPVDGTKTLAPQIEQADVGKSVVIEPAAVRVAELKAKKGK